MVAWRPNNALGKLIRQWKDGNPGTEVVYTIADDLHGPQSDHQPDDDGTVDAGDFMPGATVTAAELDDFAETLRRNRDRRIKYVIRRQRIFAGNDGPDPWVWRPYSGEYHGHTHVSTLERFEDDGSSWDLTRRAYVMTLSLDGLALPKLKYGDDDSQIAGYNYVTRMQLLLDYLSPVSIKADGVYGNITKNAVRNLSTNSDGMTVGLAEWAALIGFAKATV